jgi:hypothetical protein
LISDDKNQENDDSNLPNPETSPYIKALYKIAAQDPLQQFLDLTPFLDDIEAAIPYKLPPVMKF